uniref:Uncharacterized protein n=1 Tax=Anguilla anguilla TaxID=7936 RepID=A0A0E9P9B6_ANGAN
MAEAVCWAVTDTQGCPPLNWTRNTRYRARCTGLNT